MIRSYKIYILCALFLLAFLSFHRWPTLPDSQASLTPLREKLAAAIHEPVVHSPSPPVLCPEPDVQVQTHVEKVTQVETVYVHVPLEPVAISLVMIGGNIAHEGSIAIKSALMHTSRPLQLHIVCTEDNVPYLEKKFALFTKPMYNVDVTFYPVTIDRLFERLNRANMGHNPAQRSKLLLHEILVDVEKVIFIDTDMLFVVDPYEIWKNFDSFDENTIIQFPTLGPKSHAGQVCSCVMLMNLARMRNPSSMFIPSSLLPQTSITALTVMPFARASLEGVPNPFKPSENIPLDPSQPTPFGDQDIYHVVWYYRKDLIKHLSLRWDVSFCRGNHQGLSLGHWDENPKDEDMTEAEQIKQQSDLEGSGDEHSVLSPGILHFNCQNQGGENVWLNQDNHVKGAPSGNPTYNNNYVTGKFGPWVTAAVRYKWTWLNRGDGSAKVKIRVMSDLRWWDERLLRTQNLEEY